MIKKQKIDLKRDFYEMQLSHRDILNMVNDPNVMNGQVKPNTIFHIYLISELTGKEIRLGSIEIHEDLSIGFNKISLSLEEEEFFGIDIIKNREPVIYDYNSIVKLLVNGAALEKYNELLKTKGGVVLNGTAEVSVFANIETQGGALLNGTAGFERIVYVGLEGGAALLSGKALMGWIIELDIGSDSSTNRFSFFANRFDGTVDWGDGTVQTVVGMSFANNGKYFTHVYQNPGRYNLEININGGLFRWSGGARYEGGSIKFQHFAGSVSFSRNDRVVKIHPIPGNFGINSFETAFPYLNHPNLEIENIFQETSTVTNYRQVFFNSQGITSVPNDLFANCEDATNFEAAFAYCRNLTSVPEGLFDNFTSLTTCEAVFQQCTSLINAPRFSNCTSLTNFASAFASCTSLSTLPDGMFSNCTSLTNFASAFASCTSLSTLPDGMFSDCTSATDFNSTFNNCTSLSTLLDGMFSNCTSAIYFSNTFNNCTSLTSIPSGLFANNLDVISFGSQSMYLVATDNVVNIDSGGIGGGTFTNCTGLTDIPDDLFGSKPNVLECGSIFSGCTGLTSIPPTLFDGFSYCKRFKNVFRNCSGITQVPAQLFHNCRRAGEFVRVFYGTGISILDVPNDFFQYNKPNPYNEPVRGVDPNAHWRNYFKYSSTGSLPNSLVFIEVFGTQNHDNLYDQLLQYQAQVAGCRDVVVIGDFTTSSIPTRSTLGQNYGWKIASDPSQWITIF